ncbi:MAG: hypothetical protein EOO14_14995 [Chitinophagaceae bacterium]|nr:MAG: hypothetical protein EOO14_14995 [Chitinophagaceae bacterium]
MLLLSGLVFLFYVSIQVLVADVYSYAVVGALFELLSIPMLFLLLTLPILCSIQLFKSKGTSKLYALFSFGLLLLTIMLLVLTA